jgi:hypothetical protein
MKEALQPDDFRPIIASSLIFSKKLRRAGLQQSTLGFACLVALAIVLFFALPILLPEPFTTTKGGSTYSGNIGAAFAPITGFFLVIAGTVVLSVVIAKRLRSEADRRAANMVSPTNFLNTLNKILGRIRESEYDPSSRSTWAVLRAGRRGGQSRFCQTFRRELSAYKSCSKDNDS